MERDLHRTEYSNFTPPWIRWSQAQDSSCGIRNGASNYGKENSHRNGLLRHSVWFTTWFWK